MHKCGLVFGILTCKSHLNVLRLIEDIITDLPEGVPEEAKNYVRKMCDYTCRGALRRCDGIGYPSWSARNFLSLVVCTCLS